MSTPTQPRHFRGQLKRVLNAADIAVASVPEVVYAVFSRKPHSSQPVDPKIVARARAGERLRLHGVAVIPAEDLDLLEALELERDRRAAEEGAADPDEPISVEEFRRRLAAP